MYVCFDILSRCTIVYTYIIEQEPDVLLYTLKLLLIVATNFSGLAVTNFSVFEVYCSN